MSIEKEIDKKFIRKCFLCDQEMKYVGEFVWQCKNCNILDSITHIALPYGRDQNKRRSKIIFKRD